MIVRRFQPNDAAEVGRLFYDTVHTINIKDYTPEQVGVMAPNQVGIPSWALALEYSVAYIAVIGSQIVGFGELKKRGYVEGYLEKLYVHKDFQRRGVGLALLTQLEQEAIQQGMKKLVAEVSITAKPFFLSRGYTVLKSQKKLYGGALFLNYMMSKKLN